MAPTNTPVESGPGSPAPMAPPLRALLVGSITWGAMLAGLVVAALGAVVLINQQSLMRLVAGTAVVAFFATAIPFGYGLLTAVRGRQSAPPWASWLAGAVNGGGILLLLGVLLVILTDG